MAGLTVIGQIARDLVLVIPEVPGPHSSAQVTERREMLGGKGANIAVAAAQLGSRVALVGVVGADQTGDWLIAQAKADGIDTKGVISRPGAASALIVDLVTPDAAWRYLQDIPDETLLTVADMDANQSTLVNASSVIIQLQQPSGTAITAAACARAAGRRVVLDGAPSDDSRRDDLLAAANVLRADQQEGELLTGMQLDTVGTAIRAGRKLLRHGPALVALATDEANIFVWEQDELVIPLADTDVRDITGGGDAFTAALTVALDNGLGPRDAAHMAVAASAATVRHPGGRPDLDSAEIWPAHDERGSRPA
jgi:ribokinase